MKVSVCALVLCSLTVLGGCVGPTVVVMQDPNTKEVHECKESSGGLSLMSESIAAKACADGYTAAGWKRLN
jgi:hypothetical protein